MLISNLSKTYIPFAFQDGRSIEQVILICDVDGVVRESTENGADPRIVSAIKELIARYQVDMTFISGTPIRQDPSVDIWRRTNATLDQAIGSFFVREIQEKTVTLYGALGGQRMNPQGQVEMLDGYSLEIAFEVGKLLLDAFLEEVKHDGTDKQKNLAEHLQFSLPHLMLKNQQQPAAITANEFKEVVFTIRSQFDPSFRLISTGACLETHSSNPPWKIAHALKHLKQKLQETNSLLSLLPIEQKQVAGGFAQREQESFNFLIVSKINKGVSIQKHLEEKMRVYPHALIVTIGDTQVDFPMHQHAHLSYHVGKEDVWANHPLPHFMLVRDQLGRDSQHVRGTLHVLHLIKEAMGKSIFDCKLLP